MLEEISDSIDAIKPLACILMPVLVMVLASSSGVDAAHEFTAYRMQQYDLAGMNYGSPHVSISSEARTFESASFDRKSVFIKTDDLTLANYNKVLQSNPSSIIVIINNNMTYQQAKNLMEIEDDLIHSEPKCPVYFINEDGEIKNIYTKVTQATNKLKGSALQAIVEAASFVGYHLTSKKSSNSPMNNHYMTNIQGVLLGAGVPEQLPTIAIVAHYDSFGVTPLLSHGANSDASGVVALLQISKIFGRLYANPESQPKYNMIFLLSSGGKFNYFGSKRYIEESLENSAYSNNAHYSNSLLSNAKLVICLEALASMKQQDGPETLNLHVSKPPKQGSVAYDIYSNIQKEIENEMYQIETSMVHKKININTELSAWEHEKFSKKRLHAVTVSTLPTYDHPLRRSIMDRMEYLNFDSLVNNIDLLKTSIAHTIYNNKQVKGSKLLGEEFSIDEHEVRSWVEFLSSQSRAQQDLSENHIVVTSLMNELAHHLSPANVYASKISPDKRDPEYKFYSGMKVQIHASIVKSAFFDLYITFVIFSYVATVYVVVNNFQTVVTLAKKYGAIQKVKTA